MFDSFFGSSTTAATAAVTATATATAANATVTTEVPAVTANDTIVKLETDPTDDALAANSTDETGPPGPLTLSLASPHEGLLTGSISVNSMSSGTAPESTATAVSAADLASPGSYKLTPAPSADMQTPVQTPLVPFPNKGVEPADEVVLPRTISNTAAQGYSATQPAASLSAPAPLPMVPPASQPAAFRTQKQSTTPLPYSSIATPYDDIGRHAQSWLQDRPTPAQLTGDISDLNPQELDPHNIRFTSIMEKSLNPVSWIKRISARRMHQTGSRVKGQTPKSQPRRHSSVTSRSHIAGSSAPASLRRLRGWLVAYKAKSSYSKDFVPRHISMTGSALAASGSASAEADVLVPSTSISADAMGVAGDGHLPGETTGSNAPQSAGASAVGGSQQVHNTGSERADNAPMGVLEAITTAEGTHHDKSEAASDDRLVSK
ncbi:hypothetical protein FBU59_003940 [Linderina macrospora]|uniref:Uncharacterized protein n=1 Tax=Linderina macrospora TaxID=4868 RepID=A0ACC1J6Y4_9FUNG|nr:hypothetical protein FBU59_003940 [Linderina macrospora]